MKQPTLEQRIEKVYKPGDIVYLDTDDKARVINRLDDGSYDLFVFSIGEKRNRFFTELKEALEFID